MTGRYLTTFCIINFLGLVILFYFQFTNRQQNLAYIDSARVINAYQGMESARKTYQDKVAVWKANIDTLAKEVQLHIDKFQSTSSGMTAKEKELSRELIKTKQQQLAEYQRAISERASQEDAASTKKVIDEINAYIKTFGEEKNYTIILAATEQGNIAFAEKYLDITEQIIEGLNKKYNGKP